MHPTMVMHPYLPELNGQDLTDYEDKAGKKLFVAFVDASRRTAPDSSTTTGSGRTTPTGSFPSSRT